MDALRFVNVFFSGVEAGGVLVILLAYAPSLAELDVREIPKVHSHVHPATHRLMFPSTIIAAATAIALAAWVSGGWNASRILLIAGLLGAVAQAILSRRWVVPMSEEIIAWPETGAPQDYRAVIRRWTILHGGRVVGAVESFTCFLLSLLLAVH